MTHLTQGQSVQDIMIEKDPVALKRAYYGLFKSITVGEEDDNGVRPMTFTLRKSGDELLEDGVRLRSEMVENQRAARK